MKNLYIFLLLLIGVSGFAQKKDTTENNSIENCLTDQLLKLAIQKDPNVKKRLELLDSKINENKFQKTTNTGVEITIPIVVFVVHENGIENIPDPQILGQITALNQYFNSANIRFCLATRNRGGQPTSGIIRFDSPLTHNSMANASNLETLANGYPSDNYLKIWIVKNITGSSSTTSVQGYATFPGTNLGFDGIVIKASAFGTVGNCGGGCAGLNSSTQLGKVLVHEVGHYFGLYHTFEQGCAGGDPSTCTTAGDRVCDTPPVANRNFSCTNVIDSCPDSQNLPDDINNYMDYVSETCMTHFSDGQIERMNNLIFTQRNILVSSLNLVITGVTCIPNINCNFNASNYTVCSNNGAISFTSDWNPNGMNYTWDFGDSSTSNLQNPTHTYTTASATPYTVTLTVSDANNNSVTSSKKIFVENCTPIINSDYEWRFGGNSSISFATGVPVVQIPQNSYNHVEACANQSNSSGQMLFHSSGNKLYNGNNQIVATTLSGRLSSHQGALILPNPNPQFPNQYYLFLRKAYEQQLQEGGFTYTLVNAPTPSNVTLDPQNTEVPITIPSNYNYITGPRGIDGIEGVTAIKSCDGYWIITAGQKSNGYYLVVFKLNSTGINFISEFQLNTNINTKIAAVKASPNGNKLVLFATRGFPSTGGLFVYNFNKFTGDISNQINLNHEDIYGATFSPDSNLLYVSSIVGSLKNQYIQYNLNDVNPSLSRKSFFNTLGRTSDLKIGPDNKIYLATTNNNLSVIHKPNSIITDSDINACQFYNYGPSFPGSGSTWMGLPNLIDAKSEIPFNNSISSNPTSCNTYSFFANVCDTNFTWNFGDPGSGANNSASGANVSHTFSAEGTYTVTLTDSTLNQITTNVSVGMPTPIINGDSYACLGCPLTNTSTNNSVTLLTGERALWTVSGGTIIGFNNQSSVDIVPALGLPLWHFTRDITNITKFYFRVNFPK
ncbi:MAG: PKD domain-containing protein [Flavobacterium sp.]|nr:PKD domain-containing protein [Flavobacterium sp.]